MAVSVLRRGARLARPQTARLRRIRRNGRVSPPLNDENLSVLISQDGLPFCCGVQVLGEAKCYGGVTGGQDTASLRYVNVFGKAVFEATKNDGAGISLYTTIESQKMERVGLKKAGFVVVAKFRNPNTLQWVWLHAKLLNQPARRAASRRRTARR